MLVELIRNMDGTDPTIQFNFKVPEKLFSKLLVTFYIPKKQSLFEYENQKFLIIEMNCNEDRDYQDMCEIVMTCDGNPVK